MKRITALCLLLALISCTFIGCSPKKETTLTAVTLSEVAHSIFYAPQYAAYELGYFKDEGIDLSIETGFRESNLV